MQCGGKADPIFEEEIFGTSLAQTQSQNITHSCVDCWRNTTRASPDACICPLSHASVDRAQPAESMLGGTLSTTIVISIRRYLNNE